MRCFYYIKKLNVNIPKQTNDDGGGVFKAVLAVISENSVL